MTAMPVMRRMARKAADAAQFLRSLANPHRLGILCQLAEGEKSVGELTDAGTLAQPNVSQHLARLRAEGLVGTRREGTTIYYSLAAGEVKDIIDILYRRFCAGK